MACPGSVMAEDAMPQQTSVYAEEGTAAHELAEAILNGRPYPAHEPETLAYVSVYTDFILAETHDDDEYVVEARLDLTHLADDMFGTLDFGRWRPKTGELLIVDLKYGKGKRVDVRANKQLMAYASGLMRFFGCEPKVIRIVIVQPRQEDDPIRQWTFDPLDLFDFETDVAKAASIAFGENPPFIPGEHCRWCRAAAVCPAMVQKARNIALDEFGGGAPVLPEPGMDPEELASLIGLAEQMKAWAEAVLDFALEEAQAGRTPPGYEYVPTRPTKKWKDEQDALNWLKSSQFSSEFWQKPAELRTPLQVRKEIEKIATDEELADFDTLYASISGGMKLARLKGGKSKRAAIALEELNGEVDFLS
jgi:hypothetical protein